MTSESSAESPAVKPGSGQMFDGIADRYDLLNRLISLGIDRRWRKKTVGALQLDSAAEVLDLATGTADLALMIAEVYPDCSVTGVDPSHGMIRVGDEKITAKALGGRVRLQLGDAQELDFADNSFDGVTMAFGIRNVPDRDRALVEMARVTKPGARVALLELSEPKSGPISVMARFHMHRVVPWLGAMLSNAQEYRYLPNSIAQFPGAAQFVQQMEAAGFSQVQALPLTFGVCHLYIGQAQ